MPYNHKYEKCVECVIKQNISFLLFIACECDVIIVDDVKKKKKGNILFKDALNTFMVKDYTDNERGN